MASPRELQLIQSVDKPWSGGDAYLTAAKGDTASRLHSTAVLCQMSSRCVSMEVKWPVEHLHVNTWWAGLRVLKAAFRHLTISTLVSDLVMSC